MKKIIIIVSLLVILFTAVYYRVILPNDWLHGDTLRLPTVDAYYQARYAQIINTHGIDLPKYDPYFISSGETPLSSTPIWPLLISTLSHLFPKDGIDIVCYYLPPLLAVLSILGVFFITALLFNAWAGLFASLLLSTMGGEFMARSIAGSADYHVFEVFLLVAFSLCIVIAVKNHTKGLTVWLMSILAGAVMTIYLGTWSGAVYLYGIFTASYFLYLIILSFKTETPLGSIFLIPCVTISSTVLFYIMMNQLMAGQLGSNLDVNILIISGFFLVAVILMTILQLFFVKIKNKWGLIVIALILAVSGLVILRFFAYPLFSTLINMFRGIIEWGTNSHTSEERPILIFGNNFSLQALWGNFTASIFLCLIGVGILINRALKADKHTLFIYLFFILGTLIMLSSTLTMVRFAYYMAVYTSIMSGLIVYLIVEVSTSYLKRNSKKMNWWDKIGDIMLIIVMMSFIFIPNFMISNQFKYPLEGSLTPGWEQAMTWMKDNTPEPFGNADYYYANYTDNEKSPSYSVLSWWDYGYWITYVGHRVPTCNPGSINRSVPAVFLTTTNVDDGIKVLQMAKSRYIVIDWQTVTGKFTAMPTYAVVANKDLLKLWVSDNSSYIEQYNISEGDKLTRLNVFYPQYYESMAVRLFNFDCKAVKSPGCPVIIYTEHDGQKWVSKVIDTPSLQEALNYIDKNPLKDGSLYTYGGTDPFLSCVDLPQVKDIVPLKGFGGADLSGMSQAVKQTWEVKVFQYTGDF